MVVPQTRHHRVLLAGQAPLRGDQHIGAEGLETAGVVVLGGLLEPMTGGRLGNGELGYGARVVGC